MSAPPTTPTPGTIMGTDRAGAPVSLGRDQHLLITGAAGSGKSHLAATIVAAHLDADAHVYVAGTQRTLADYAPFAYRLAGIATTAWDAHTLIQCVRTLTDNRLEGGANTDDPVLLVIDDAHVLLASDPTTTPAQLVDLDRLRTALTGLLTAARGVAVQVVIATQSPSRQLGLPPAATFDARVSLGPTTGLARVALFGAGGAPAVAGRHDAVIQIGDQEPHRIDLAHAQTHLPESKAS
ncbi:ATP-binding protein [Tersicoccus sp. MR15.9]|uniref:ATP-binding protein n=1 Tax=Tersicoccus mangrovi TaxID=3121635 RepID=UPI002FE65051